MRPGELYGRDVTSADRASVGTKALLGRVMPHDRIGSQNLVAACRIVQIDVGVVGLGV